MVKLLAEPGLDAIRISFWALHTDADIDRVAAGFARTLGATAVADRAALALYPSTPMTQLSGQVAIVTGGGRGLGRAVAEALAALLGASVVVASRNARRAR